MANKFLTVYFDITGSTYLIQQLVEKINWLETPQMSHTNDPLLNAKKC